MGMPINSYAAGARKYRGTSSAPNTGAVVNKTGYNERELRKQAQQQALASRLQNNIKKRGL